MSDADTENWQRREDLLDTLLSLPPEQQQAFLLRLQQTNSDDANALRSWLKGIEQSEHGWLQQSASAQSHEGEVVGNWRALQLLGRGGMGEVWLGERADGMFDKAVAIKFVRSHEAALVQGIEAERRVLARLVHPGIVRLLDAGSTASGQPYLVTDYVDGQRLDTWLNQHTPSLKQRVALFEQIATAVSHAHGQLIVHRDIKPGNVLVDQQGNAHLLDFGIAQRLQQANHAASNVTALTPEFAAPEVLTGQTIDVRTDIYALGALLYFMLCQHPPLALHGLARAQLLEQLQQQAPAPLVARIPGHLRADASKHWLADIAAIAQHAMAKQPLQRYATVDGLLRDIRAATHQYPVKARALGKAGRWALSLRRNRSSVAAGTLLLASLLAGLASTLWQAQQATVQRDLAQAQARSATAARDFLVEVFESANPEITQGQSPSAIELLDAGVRRIQAELTDEPALQAELMATLGDSYAGLGQYGKSEQLLARALALAQASGLPASSQRQILSRYARAVLLNSGPYPTLEPLLQQALATPDASNPAQQVQLRAYYGGLLYRTGQAQQAQQQLTQAVADARALTGTNTSALSTALYQYAQWQAASGQREQAITTLEEMLNLQQQQPLLTAAYQQRVMQELATLLGDVGRSDDSQAMLQRLYQETQRHYGQQHPATIAADVGLGRARLRSGDTQAAHSQLQNALTQAERWHGEDSEIAAYARSNVAASAYAQGHLADAIALTETTHQHILAREGEHGPRRLLMLQNLARLELEAGNDARAQALLQQALRGLQATGSHATGEPLALLGDIASRRGDALAARQWHQQALDAYANAGDTSSIDVQEHRLSLAEDERNLGNFDVARQHAQRGLDGLLKLGQDSNDGMVQYARYVLAQVDVLQQRCPDSAHNALQQLRDARRLEFADSTVPPNIAWRLQRIDLYLGLCLQQRQGEHAHGVALATTAARQLHAQPLADAYTQQLAQRVLQGKAP